jgi:site-specific recombinase XerD
MKTILLETREHRGQMRICLYFPFDADLAVMVRKIEGCRWSKTMNCWHIPMVPDAKRVLQQLLPGIYLKVGGGESDEDSLNIIEASIDRRKKVFYVLVPYELKDWFKKIEGAWWHPGATTWSAPDNETNRRELEAILQRGGYRVKYRDMEATIGKLAPVRAEIPVQNRKEPDEKFERIMRIQGKSESTIRMYKSYVSWYLSEMEGQDIRENASELVKDFVFKSVINNRYGNAQQNGVISALKLYYDSVHFIELTTDDIPRPKKRRSLPKVISEEEFRAMYATTRNSKHKLILMLLYGCGLRRGELCQLRVEDVDFDRGLLFVKGKGEKYRVVNPGAKLLGLIRKYIKSYLPEHYLIEGPDRGMYSGSSIGAIVKEAAYKAGIERRVHPHMLRHSFATHHMERGVELRLIQETMGHSSSKTTEIYTYVSRASIKKMPALLDDLEI